MVRQVRRIIQSQRNWHRRYLQALNASLRALQTPKDVDGIPETKDPMAEARFIKAQQFRTVNYALLLEAAIVALFQIQIPLGFWHNIVKVVVALLLFAIGFISDVYQRDHYRGLLHYRNHYESYRRRLKESESKQCFNRILIHRAMKKVGYRRAREIVGYHYVQDKRTWYLYTWILRAIVWLGTVAAGIAVAFDPYYF